MADILLRASLARGLTNDEVDANLVALNNELSTKVDQAGARASISVSGALSYNASTGVISFTDAVTSVAGKTGAVSLTKSDVGLPAVENKSSSTIRSELTSGNVIGALGFTPPATDGSGASGTWGISVSGNAATASSASKWASARTLTLTGDVTGSVSMDGSGNVSMSTAVGNDSHLHTQLYREDNRTLAPSELGAGYMRFGFTSWANNSSSPYADFIHLRSYTDSSGGADNLVMFRKSAPGMRIWQQAWGSSTAYSSYVDVLDSSNYTSWVGNGAMTVTAGSGLTGGGLLGTANQSGATSVMISHADTSSQASVNNSGATFIQDVTLDTYGHVTGLSSATVSIGDGAMTVAAGSGLSGGGQLGTANQSGASSVTLSHADTSSQASVNNSNGTVIQDVTLDTYGHVTALASTDLDTRYLRRNVNESTTGYLQAEGFVNAGVGSLSIFNPQNANYASTSSSVTGAIRIRLPVGWTNTMLRMTIRVYEYASNEGFDVVCGGYNYGGNSTWYNTFAYILGSPNVNRNFNIRFGNDGLCCVYIGETNSVWSYPQVAVTQIVAGYGSYDAETWNDGWDIGFVTSMANISSTISNAEIGRYLDGNTIITTAGGGLTKSNYTLSHADTSSQGSVNNSGATVIQDLTLDGYGHVTGLASVTLSYATVGAPSTTGTNASGTWGISISGNAATTTKLATARTINGVSFDGSANITITADANAHTHDRINDSSGSYLRLSSGNEVEFFNSSGSISTVYFNYSSTDYSSVRGPQGAVFLNTGNYNSYVPSTTGANASGTWGISITGNAATATTTDKINGRTFYCRDSGNALSQDSYYYNGLGYVNGVSLFGQSDGGMYAAAYSTSWVHQIYGDFRTGQIAVRGKNNGTWQSWRTVLDSSNYNSYAPTKTGGGASGSWGISVTGSAGSLASSASASEIYNTGWFRAYGQRGLYCQDYGGGIYMVDTTWVRVYNSKAFYVANNIAATGDVTAYYSDERLKTKIGHIPGALDKVLSLNGFYYRENDLAKSFGYSSVRVQMALSAQDVQKVAPEVVSLAPFDMHTDETSGEITSRSGEDYLTVNYARLVPLLVEAIKEQDSKIKHLSDRVDQLMECLK